MLTMTATNTGGDTSEIYNGTTIAAMPTAMPAINRKIIKKVNEEAAEEPKAEIKKEKLLLLKYFCVQYLSASHPEMRHQTHFPK